jgi:hypothetical protein
MKNNIASDFLVNIFKKFKKKSIEYVVLRNYEKLPFDNDSKDVDILIKPSTIDNTLNLILKEAKELGYNCIWLNPLDYLVGLVLAKIENGIIYSIKIDLFIGLKWRGIEYINSDLILSKKIPYKEFFVPSKESEAFIMIMYYILYAKGIRDKYLNHIYCYATNNIDDFNYILTKTLDLSLSLKISKLITQNQIEEIVSLRKDIIKKLLSKNINLSYIFNLLKHIKSEYIDRKKFGSMVNITNLNSEELNVLKECFISLGISKEKQKSINIELKNNNIMLIDKSININKDSRYITIEKENSFEDKLTKIFKELEKRYLK